MNTKLDLHELKEQGKKLHLNLFGFQAKGEILDHYIQAHKTYAYAINLDELDLVIKASKKIKNLIHLEYFLRFKNGKNILTQQKMILFYICELQPEYELYFKSQDNTSFIGTICLILKYSLKSAISLLLGWVQYLKLRGSLREHFNKK